MKIANGYTMVQNTEVKAVSSKETLGSSSEVRQMGKEAAFDDELSKAGLERQSQDEPMAADGSVKDLAEEPVGEAIPEKPMAEEKPVVLEKREAVEMDLPAEGKALELDLAGGEQPAEDAAAVNTAAMFVAMANAAMIAQPLPQTGVSGQAVSSEELTEAAGELTEATADCLEALLPQDEKAVRQAAQNGQLLDMLPGKAVIDLPLSGEVKQNVSPDLQSAVPQKLQTIGLSNEQQEALPLAQPDNQPDVPNVSQKAAEFVSDNPVVVTAAADLQGAGSVEPKLSAGDEDKRSHVLEDIPLIVEDKTSANRIVANDTNAQMSGDMLPKQPEGDRQQTLKLSADGKLVQQGDELPEEADFDVAGVVESSEASVEGNATAGTGTIVQSFGEAAASSEVNEASSEVPEDFDIPKQIIEQARLIRSDEDTQMVIKLKPDHLGELTLKISVSHGGTVNASFHSDNAQVRGIIESTMVQLKQELAEQGLKVDNVDVRTALDDGSLMDSQAGQQGYYAQQQSQGTRAVRSRKADVAAFEADDQATAVAPAEAEARMTGSDGVDYLV